ncbi:LytTR family DNA-binding domain-containing protein [Clostridium boliviensis]|uniref:Stage 0 sporulation protein A homolog n=1 Tax=Clostridium boliviensis TaxID=318465 RepID=A0ABU4GL23_9CLOT|nr:LytTR family DNA-binding domain-containing protein [Clostridium boliviensis]MDW2798310.1 LytTR family DNA-binding domain-containing protein [Clostridium boliviensis]
MENIHIVVCDDEVSAVKLIKERLILILTPLIKFACYEYTDPYEVVNLAKDTHIDLLLIDIEMPDIKGFDVVKEVRRHNNQILVLFITNMDMYVYESFKFQPFRFIRKSHMDELNEALVSAVTIIKNNMEIFNIPINLVTNKEVKVNDIIYFESLHNNVKVVLNGDSYVYRSTLKHIEKQLEGKKFVRIHSGFLVNLKYVYLIRETIVEVNCSNKKILLPLSRNRRINLISEYKRSLR